MFRLFFEKLSIHICRMKYHTTIKIHMGEIKRSTRLSIHVLVLYLGVDIKII